MISEKFRSKLEKTERVLANTGAFLAAIALFATTILITIGSVGRYVFSYNIMGVDELSAYMLVTVTYVGLAYTLREKAHISINIVIDKLGEPIVAKLRVFRDVTTLVMALIFSKYAVDAFIESFTGGERALTMLQTPMWIPRSIICIGWFLFLLSLIRVLLEDIRKVKSDVGVQGSQV